MEENRQIITYDEDWQSVCVPETPVVRTADDEAEEDTVLRVPSERRPPRNLLLTIRLIVCILLGVAAFALKNLGGEVYEAARKWYCEQLSSTAIFDGSPVADGLWAATADEA